MRYVLRGDASRIIGAGHVMRCSAIAEELINREEYVIFVGQISDLPWLTERISTLGFNEIYNTDSLYFSNSETDVLVLDSYEIDINDSFVDPKNWHTVVVIYDELTPNYSCKLRIHPGLDTSFIHDSTIPVLSGPRYVPFRSSLTDEKFVGGVKDHILKIAIVAGGSDSFGLVHEIAKILSKFDENFEVYLFAKAESEIVLDSRFSYFEIGNQLDVITKNVDLVLSTAGTSCLEFIARGLCVGLVSAVDNQTQNYNTLGKLGVAAQLGTRSVDNTWDLDEQKIYSLVTSSELRKGLVSKAKGLLDFDGARRIVDAITAF
jgi:spore coat polysaccharide biosynthesis predicted glycosyltransferase SpsG